MILSSAASNLLYLLSTEILSFQLLYFLILDILFGSFKFSLVFS